MEEKEPKETPELDRKDAKLKKALIKYGVSEEEAVDFLQYLKGMPDEEDKEPTEESPQEPVEEEGKEMEGEEAPAEEPTMEEPAEPAEEPSGEVPPVEEAPTPSEPTEAPVEPQEPTEPVVEEPSAEPQAEPIDFQAKYEEAQKTIDALSARFDSLEEALQKSGVLLPQQNPVGVSSEMPEGSNLESSNDDVLKLLNK